MLSSVLNPSIAAGELVHTIQIQAQSTAPDPTSGEPSTAWATFLSTRARILTAAQARSVFQGGQFAAEVTHVITIRYPGCNIAIAGEMQVLFRGQTFTIQTVENVLFRDRILHLMCIQIDGAQ
jgi:SPP1 family predicted phage head-tail adaptor